MKRCFWGDKAVKATARVRTYDFRQPSKFDKDQLHAMQLIVGHFARYAAAFLVNQFRVAVLVSPVSVEQETFEQFTTRLQSSTAAAIGRLQPLPGRFVAALDDALARPMIDLMFGGSGGAESAALTDIELRVIERLFHGLFAGLAEAFQEVVEVTPSLDGVETNPLFLQVVTPETVCLSVILEVTLGARQGFIHVTLPHLMLEPLAERLVRHLRPESPRADTAGQWDLKPVPLVLSAELGKASLPLYQFLRLEIGDVLVLDSKVTQDVLLRVGRQRVARGQIGASGRMLGFKFVRWEEEQDE